MCPEKRISVEMLNVKYLGDGLGARAPAHASALGRAVADATVNGTSMVLNIFLIGLPVMLLCLMLQVAVAFWRMRHCAHHGALVGLGKGFLSGMRPLIIATVAMLVGTLLQIALWGCLFLWLGEFEQAYDAITARR